MNKELIIVQSGSCGFQGRERRLQASKLNSEKPKERRGTVRRPNKAPAASEESESAAAEAEPAAAEAEAEGV